MGIEIPNADIQPLSVGIFGSERNADRVMYLAAGLWALLVFSGWSAAQAIFSEISLVRLMGIGEDNFSSVTSWLPLASEIARGNLFPTAPALGNGATGLQFFPYLTLWLHGLTIAVFGLKGTAVIAETVCPTLGFLLLVGLFRRFLQRRWSVTLAALGFLAFIDFPLRAFLGSLALGKGWREVGINALPDIAQFPIPALTVSLFLVTLLVSLKRKRLHLGRLTLITLMWASLSQVHLVNAAVGIIFWFTHFPLELLRQNRMRPKVWVLRQTAIQGMLTLAVLLPAVVAWSGVATGKIDFLGSDASNYRRLFGAYYYFAYLFLPLALTGILYVVTRLDYYELLTRFRPIYALMAVEFILVSFNLMTGRGIPSENLFSRLGLYVLHPLYYVPIIHLLTRLENKGPAERISQGEESGRLARTVRRTMRWLTMDASKVYLPMFFVVLTAYAASSAMASYRYSQQTGLKLDLQQAAVVYALADGAVEGEGLATDWPSANLLVPIIGRYSSLWVSRFANNIDRQEIIDRLALFARLAGWSQNDFQNFMAPTNLRDLAPIQIDRDTPPTGVGYWLAFHREATSGAGEIQEHLRAMARAFNAVDINADACRFGITRWLARIPPPDELAVREAHETPHGQLYILAWDAAAASRNECPERSAT